MGETGNRLSDRATVSRSAVVLGSSKEGRFRQLCDPLTLASPRHHLLLPLWRSWRADWRSGAKSAGDPLFIDTLRWARFAINSESLSPTTTSTCQDKRRPRDR